MALTHVLKYNQMPPKGIRKMAPLLFKNFLTASLFSTAILCLIVLVLFLPGALAMGMGGGGGTTTIPAQVSLRPLLNRVAGLRSPSRVAMCQNGNVYISDSKGGVVAIVNGAGTLVGTLTGIMAPLGLDVTTAGTTTRVYVGDEADGSVRIFENGILVSALGNGPLEFYKPNGIAVSSDGTVYVVDSQMNHVAVYTDAPTRQFTFGTQGSGDGNLNFPTDIALNEAAGELYVADHKNERIAVFNTSGIWLRNIAAPLNSAGDPAFFKPAGIGIDPDTRLYVVDNALSCVVIMTVEGALIDIIGYDNGQYWTGDLAVPIDAASDGSVVWVSSSQNRYVNAYEVLITDNDTDGVDDTFDNCPGACNFQQLDADGDGSGDVCDPTPGCGGCTGFICEEECGRL